MRKLIASVALVTAVAVGGLAVAAVNPLQISSAKSSKTSSTQVDPGSTKAAPDARRGRLGARLLDRALAGLVKKGTISADQAKAVKTAIQGEVQHVRKAGKGLRRGAVVVSAKAIGISPEALVTELKSGKSIAQVAQAKHVSVDDVTSAIVRAGTTRVDTALHAGKIDPAKAAKIKARLPALAEKIVNRVPRHR